MWIFPAFTRTLAGCADVIGERYRRFVAGRTMWSRLNVVSTPTLQLFLYIAERKEEPVRVEAFGLESFVERFDDWILGRHSWPGEVEHCVFLKRP